MSRRTAHRLLIGAMTLPAAWLAVATIGGRLGANPIDALTDTTGTWTLRLLVASLAITPLRRLTGWGWLAPYRRTLGLAAFAYGVLHALTYLVLDQFFDWSAILKDITRRPFITAGFTGFVVLLVLAATSPAVAVRRLGGATWRRIHRLAYLAAAAGVVHYWWLVKADIRRPLAYGVVVLALLGVRAWWSVRVVRAAG